MLEREVNILTVSQHKRHFRRLFVFQSVQLKINLPLSSLERKIKGKDLALAENNENLFASFHGQRFLRHLVLDLGKPTLELMEVEGLCYFQ